MLVKKRGKKYGKKRFTKSVVQGDSMEIIRVVGW